MDAEVELEDGEEWGELRDADIKSVHAVKAAANGTRILFAKQAAPDASAGLFGADFVRDLIAKSEPATEPQETVTMTGSPAAMAALIHQAAIRKAKYNADDLKRMASSGAAMPDESYPIEDHEDLDRAIRAVGRGGSSHDAIRRHIESRARALGASSEIPDNWGSDGSLKKADGMADDLDPTTVLAEPDGDAPGDENAPGSPAWEAIDAATARKWTGIAVRLKNALSVMADREMLEAATGDCDDAGEAWSLQDAECALDYVIDTLAGFAVGEQAEAELGGEALEAVGKAMSGFDVAPLEVLEAFAPVRKAGRVLSAGNESAIRGAVDALQKVLASLPAPTTDDGQPVAKQTKETAVSATATVQAPLAAGETVLAAPEVAKVANIPAVLLKADKKPMYVVCDATGKPVGVCDPDDIMPIADMGGTGETSAPESAADTGDAADGAVIPGTQTIAAPAPAADGDEEDVAKSTDPQAHLAAALKEAISPLAEGLAQYAQLADVVKGLQGRVDKWGRSPDDRRSPVMNGATGAGAGLALHDGAGPDPLAELAKAVADAPEGPARDAASTELALAKIRARFS
jgi:hypothetical protein